MRATMYFKVKNLERFQHYKNRTPPWIKLYNEILEDYDFTYLPDASKYHFIAITLLASRTKNEMPYDPKWVAKKISATEPVNLDVLMDAGFISIIRGLEGASKPLADCTQDAIAERETEREGEGEKEAELLHNSEHKALGIKIDQRKKSTVKSIGEIIAPSNKPEYGTFGYWMGYIRTRYGSKLSKEAYSWAGKLWIEKTGPDDGSDFWKITRQKVELLITFVFDEFIEEDREFSYPVAQKKFSNPTILEDAGRSDKRKAQENANAGKLIEGGFGNG